MRSLRPQAASSCINNGANLGGHALALAGLYLGSRAPRIGMDADTERPSPPLRALPLPTLYSLEDIDSQHSSKVRGVATQSEREKGPQTRIWPAGSSAATTQTYVWYTSLWTPLAQSSPAAQARFIRLANGSNDTCANVPPSPVRIGHKCGILMEGKGYGPGWPVREGQRSEIAR
jgi:hypothetical protein